MDESEYDEEDDLGGQDDHPTFSGHRSFGDNSRNNNNNRQNITQSDWTLQMTPRQRNRGMLGDENAPLTPTNPLNRETYTLQEENEASFSSMHPSQQLGYNPHSSRWVHSSDSVTEAGGNSMSGGSTRGGGSTVGEGSINIDSPRTPSSLGGGGGGGMSKRLMTRDNSMMQFSVTDGTAKEVQVDGTATAGKDGVAPSSRTTFRPLPDHSHPTPNSHKASLGSYSATSMVSVDSAHSHSMAGGLHPSLPSSYRHGQHNLTVEEEAGDVSSVESNHEFEPIVIMGVKLPNWLSRIIYEPPNAARISTFVVRAAPCFWCCGDSVQATSTDRAVLNRLLILCIFVSLVQLTGSLWLAAVLLVLDKQHGMFSEFAPNFWNLNGAALAVGSLAFAIIASCFFTIRVVRVVDLVGAIRHLWVLLWLLPLQFFFTIVLVRSMRVGDASVGQTRLSSVPDIWEVLVQTLFLERC
jgi:hypothetical protein